MKRKLKILIGNSYMRQKTNYFRYLLSGKRAVLGYKPVVLSVVSTTKCTLSCDMCPTHSRLVPKDYRHRQTPAKDMSFELFKRITNIFGEALSVHIIGAGEPMLNKDFFKIANYAEEKMRAEVKTFTNGTTVGKNAENILNSGLHGLTVSINGHDREEFSRMTGMPGNIFEQICTDTGRLIEEKNKRNKKLKVNLAFIIDKTNYRFMYEMVTLAEKLGADHIFLCNFLPCPHGDLIPQKRAIMKEDRMIEEFIKSFKKSLSENLKKKISLPKVIDGTMKENRCGMHFNQVRVDGDENVSSCSMMLLNMQKAGKLSESDPWNSDFLVSMRKKFLGNNNLDEICFYCPNNKGVEV